MKPSQYNGKTPLLNLFRKAFRIAVLKSKNAKHAPPANEWADALAAAMPERRKFISDLAKAGIAVSAAGLIASCRKVNDVVLPADDHVTQKVIAQPDIVIIGAGMAGLNCAYQLKKAGYSARVYEGAARTGGRIFSAKNLLAPGLVTEMGGEFIDSDHLDMLNLCKEFNLPLIDTLGASEAGLHHDSYFLNGQFYTISQVIAAFEPYAEQIQSDIDSLPDSITFNDYGDAARFDRLSISAYFDSIGMSGWIRKALETAYLTEYGTETDEQSCINFLFLFSPDTTAGTFDIFGSSDERYKLQGGNQRITDALYNQVKNNVYLEHALLKIKQETNGRYSLYFNCGNHTPAVKADIVVMCIPFSVLRNIEVDVQMPPWKKQAIQHLGYGSNAKLFFGFNHRIWRDYNYSGYVFTDGIVQNGWDNSQLQPVANGGFTVFLGGNAGKACILGTPQSYASPVIGEMDKMWPGAKAAYNGVAHRMHWPTYPFTLGSYACYRTGQWTTIAGAEGRRIDKLYFAGEHCSLAFQGYMNGAAETGRKVAGNIVKALKTGNLNDIETEKLGNKVRG